MSVESRIKAAIAFTNYPCVSEFYEGTEAIYFVMMVDVSPTNFANDAPQNIRNSIMLHLVAPLTFDHVAIRKTLKDAIFAAGFSYPTETDASGARERDGAKEKRIIFEFEDLEAV